MSTHHNPYSQAWGNQRPPALRPRTPSLFGALPSDEAPALPNRPKTITQTRFIFVPKPGISPTLRGIFYSISSPQGQLLYTASTNSEGTATALRTVAGSTVAAITWGEAVQIRGSEEGNEPINRWLHQDPNHRMQRIMTWHAESYIWRADEEAIYLLPGERSSHILATVRTRGTTFEVEFSVQALEHGLLEPSLVALMIIKWGHRFSSD